MDSAVAAAWTRRAGYRLVTLCVDYGQRPRAELQAARNIAEWAGSEEHVLLEVDLRSVGGSALTGDIDVPKDGAEGEGIPATYVPARNTLFLALALGLAEARAANALVIGVNAVDYSGYPDCRPEFLSAFEVLARVGTKAGAAGRAPRVLAPLLDMSKSAIVRLGVELGVPFGRTVSCYDPDAQGRACGSCDSCRLRRRGFAEAGLDDPTPYR